MPHQFVAQTDTIVHLPWLARFDDPHLDPRYHPSKQEVSAGCEAYVDADLQRARITQPNGRSRTYDGLTRIRVEPGTSWSVEWPHLEPDARIWFEDTDGERSLYTENVQGREDLFPQFLMLMADPFHNPGTFDLPDGEYPSNNGGPTYDVTFGRSGDRPSLMAQPEYLGVQPDFPYKALVVFHRDTDVTDQKGQSIRIPAKDYVAQVESWNTRTGEVGQIRLRRGGPVATVPGDALIRLIAQRVVSLHSVMQERTFYF